ncbi:MAG: hypothetical protein WC841_01045 [Candidatus Shapirobacteria bacterium]|jgi:hypothetical protein
MTDLTKNKSDNQISIVKLEEFLDLYLVQKAPALPDNIKEFIVKYGPYISLVMMVLMAPALIGLIGLSSVAMPFAYLGGVRSGFNFSLSTILMIGQLALQVIALPGLFKRAKSAWRLMFYSVLVSIVYSLLAGNLINGLVSALISFYILFQVKSYYKN